MVETTYAEEYWFDVVMDGVIHLGRALHNEGPTHVDFCQLTYPWAHRHSYRCRRPTLLRPHQYRLCQNLIHGAVRWEGFWA
jgi:hypothetical protein